MLQRQAMVSQDRERTITQVTDYENAKLHSDNGGRIQPENPSHEQSGQTITMGTSAYDRL